MCERPTWRLAHQVYEPEVLTRRHCGGRVLNLSPENSLNNRQVVKGVSGTNAVPHGRLNPNRWQLILIIHHQLGNCLTQGRGLRSGLIIVMERAQEFLLAT